MIKNSKVLRFLSAKCGPAGLEKLFKYFVQHFTVYTSFLKFPFWGGGVISLKLKWEFTVRIYQGETLELNGYLV